MQQHSKQIRCVANFDTGAEFIYDEKLSTDWLVWVKHKEPNGCRNFYMHIGECRREEIAGFVDESITAFYTGPLVVVAVIKKVNVDIGRLSIQMEKSRAAIENRPVRNFKGGGVRI
jgi:hypothetical protein